MNSLFNHHNHSIDHKLLAFRSLVFCFRFSLPFRNVQQSIDAIIFCYLLRIFFLSFSKIINLKKKFKFSWPITNDRFMDFEDQMIVKKNDILNNPIRSLFFFCFLFVCLVSCFFFLPKSKNGHQSMEMLCSNKCSRDRNIKEKTMQQQKQW